MPWRLTINGSSGVLLPFTAGVVMIVICHSTLASDSEKLKDCKSRVKRSSEKKIRQICLLQRLSKNYSLISSSANLNPLS